jgi:hypothetical protein
MRFDSFTGSHPLNGFQRLLVLRSWERNPGQREEGIWFLSRLPKFFDDLMASLKKANFDCGTYSAAPPSTADERSSHYRVITSRAISSRSKPRRLTWLFSSYPGENQLPTWGEPCPRRGDSKTSYAGILPSTPYWSYDTTIAQENNFVLQADAEVALLGSLSPNISFWSSGRLRSWFHRIIIASALTVPDNGENNPAMKKGTGSSWCVLCCNDYSASLKTCKDAKLREPCLIFFPERKTTYTGIHEPSPPPVLHDVQYIHELYYRLRFLERSRHARLSHYGCVIGQRNPKRSNSATMLRDCYESRFSGSYEHETTLWIEARILRSSEWSICRMRKKYLSLFISFNIQGSNPSSI